MGRVAAKLDRVLGMVRKELLQIARDPRLRAVVFVSPLIQLVVFGYAVSTDVRNTAIFVVDQSRSQVSRELIEAFTAPGTFRVAARSDDPVDLTEALDRGSVTLGVVIPPDFAGDLARTRAPGGAASSGASIQILVDGTNSTVGQTALGYAERIASGFGLEWSLHQVGTGLRPPLELAERAWYNPDLESRNYNVPAVVGTLMMLVALLLTSLAVVRERELGTLEQLMVSPLTPAELIAGKTIPFALIAFVDLALVMTVALAWFEIPFRGSFTILLVASALFLLPALGTGLLISTVSSTQQEAFLTTFLVFMPVILLSGFVFPISSMPELFQWATLANPLRHYLEIVRGVFLKDAGLDVLWRQHLSLLGLGVVLQALAAWRFRRQSA